jgi:hypothetical protein
MSNSKHIYIAKKTLPWRPLPSYLRHLKSCMLIYFFLKERQLSSVSLNPLSFIFETCFLSSADDERVRER